MTQAWGIVAVALTAVFCLLGQHLVYRRELRKHGEAMFHLGQDFPEPQGRHHLTATEAEEAITQFLIDSGVEAEPLPKRTPGATL